MVSTYFTLLLDMQSSTRSVFGTLIENVIRKFPPCGCKIRMATYGVYNSGEKPRLLVGRYVSTGEELRRQWAVVSRSPVECGIRRLEATLAALFKADGEDKGVKRIGVLVSSDNWPGNPLFMAALASTCALGVEVQFFSYNNANAVVALLHARCNSLPSNPSSVQMKDWTAFNNQIVNGLMRFQREIDISHFLQPVKKGGCGWKEAILQDLLREVLWNNPLLFHVAPGGGVQTARLKTTGEIVRAVLAVPYTCSAECYRDRRQKVERAAAVALKTIAGVTNVVEKVKRLHDNLVANCQYSMAGYGSRTMQYRTVYDALVCRQAVCEGLTITFRYLLLLAGIESKKVVSDAMHHCWNYVQIGGDWYHVDVTFDNPIIEGAPVGMNRCVSHEFFLLSDAALLAKGKHHDWGRLNLPSATDTRFDCMQWG